MKKNVLYYYFLTNMLFIMLFITPVESVLASKLPEGSMIANVSVNNMSNEKAREILETEVMIWKSQDDIKLTSEFEQLNIPRSVFQFNIDETIIQLNDKTKRTLTSLFMRQKNVRLPLNVKLNENDQALLDLKEKDYINYEAVMTKLAEVASELEETDVTLVYTDEDQIPLETMSEVEIEIPRLSDAVLTYAIQQIDGHVIGDNEYFSLLETVQFPESLTKTDEELSFLSTALYSLFLQTNFNIIERHHNKMIPAYVEPGLDSLIDRETNKDLIVINPNKISHKLKVDKQKNLLIVELQSSDDELTYEYEVEEIEEIKQRTIYRYSNTLSPGEERTIDEGQKGLQVKVNRSTYNNDVYIESEVISKDIYLPEPTILLVSSASEEDITDVNDEVETDESTNKTIENDIVSGNFDDDDIDPNLPSLHEQILDLKEDQQTLQDQLNLLVEAFDLFYEAEYTEFTKEISEQVSKLSEEIEKIIQFILNEEEEEVESGG